MKRFYFSRRPGCFVDEDTGKEILKDIQFTGTVREWYEMMIKFIPLKAEQVFQNKENFEALVSEDVMTIFCCTLLFNLKFDKNGNYLEDHGNVDNQFDVSINKNQQRNLISLKQNDKEFEIEIIDMNII